MRKRRHKIRRSNSNSKQRNSGVALLMVLFTLMLMSVLGIELIFASRVDLRIGRNARDRIQAYYLAQSAARLSILRLHAYQLLFNQIKADGGNAGMLAAMGLKETVIDQSWALPLPPLPLAGSQNAWPGQIQATVNSEGSKIPINLLDGNKDRASGDAEAKAVEKQVQELIAGKLEEERFGEQYKGLRAEDLVASLKAWVSSAPQREDDDYERLDPPYKPRKDRMPSLSELHMVRGWTDDLVQRIAGQFSVLNTRTKVNPNYLSLDRIRAMSARSGAELSNDDLQKLQQHRMIMPFSTLDEMSNWINAELRSSYQRFSVGELKGDSAENTFVIEASGIVGEARRVLRLAVRVEREASKKPQTPAAPTDPAQQQDDQQQKSAEDKRKLVEPRVIMVEEML